MNATGIFRTGLKLWSTNVHSLARDALRLYETGSYDYLELYAVPGTSDTLPVWKSLGIPTVIHAAHFKHNFNPARSEQAENNRRIYDETRRFADELDAQYIIFHGGTFGCINETARQLTALGDPRTLIENKPAITYDQGKTLECRGATPAEIKHVTESCGCGFCLDIPHALCAANFHGLAQDEVLREFCALQPVMFHLADMRDISQLVDDHTPLGQGRLEIPRLIPSVLPPGSMVTIETNRKRHDSLSEFEEELSVLARMAEMALSAPPSRPRNNPLT